MSQQNLLSVGFNVEELAQQAAEVETIVKELYENLKSYDSTKAVPINVTGLTQLVNAIKSQQSAMKGLQTTVSELGLAMKAYNDLATQTAIINGKIVASDSQMAQANAAAKVSFAEKNRLLKEGAQALDADYQHRQEVEAKKKALAEQEIELERLIAEEEKEKQREIVAAEKEALAERIAQRKEYTALWIGLLNEQDAEQKRILAEESAAAKVELDEHNALINEAIAADEERTAEANRLSQERIKQQQLEGKAMLAQNDLFKQLKAKQADLQVRYANSIISNAPKDVQQGLARELEDTNKAINTVNSSLGKTATGGAAVFGKSLSSALGSVRQLAYILPGIGMAGLFNLAFEAIMECVKALGFFNDKLLDTIEFEDNIIKGFQDAATAVKDINNALGAADKLLVQQAQNQLNASQAAGDNYEQQKVYIDALDAAKKKAADDDVARTGATQDKIDKLNEDVFFASRDRLAADAKMQQTYRDLQEEKSKEVKIPRILAGTAAGALYIAEFAGEKALLTKKLENQLEENKAELKLVEDNISYKKTKAQEMTDALKAQNDAEQGIRDEALKNEKYWSDNDRALVLSNAEAKYNAIIDANKKILDNTKSTQSELLHATYATGEAEKGIAQAELDNVIKNANATGLQRTEATNKYNKKIADIDTKDAKDSAKIIAEFYLKHTELIFQTKQLEVTMNQIADKKIMENQEMSYDKRLKGLEDYTHDREQLVTNQYNKDLKYAQDTLSPDLLGETEIKLRTEYNKQILEIENDVREEAYNIAQTWYNKQKKLVEDNGDAGRAAAEDEGTKELLALREKLDKKEITYKEFEKQRQKIEHDSSVSIANARVEDDKSEIAGKQKLQDDLGGKIAQNVIDFTLAPTKEKRDRAKGELGANLEAYKANGKEIEALQATQSKDQLTAAEIHDKMVDDAHKQLRENWKQVEEQAFDDVKQVADSFYEYRINQIQHMTEVYDEAAQMEIDSIGRSTLAAKDKNAYEVQLQAQKTARDKAAAKETRKLTHDEAVFNKAVDIAKIIASTEIAIMGALAETKDIGAPLAGALAISYAALGAIALATTAATKIPSYKEGGTHKGGLALFGEGGSEMVVEPSGYSYVANKPTIKHLPAGTELIPLYKIPEIPERGNDSWAQTMYLGKAIANSKREIKNVFRPKINIDLGKEAYINRIING